MKKSMTINPALKDLEALAGEWDAELSAASFLPSLEDKLHGRTTFEWIEGGAFLAMRQADATTWVIGRDELKKDYEVFYSDARGVSRIYGMSFGEGMWKMWRNTPEFSQRFEGKISDDFKTVTAYWQKSLDGKKWEHDFNVKYTM